MTPEAVLALMGLPPQQAMTAQQTATMISGVIIQVGQEFQATAATVEQARESTQNLRQEVHAALLNNASVAEKAAKDLRDALETQEYKLVHTDADVKDSLEKVAANIAQVQSLGAEFRGLTPLARCPSPRTPLRQPSA